MAKTLFSSLSNINRSGISSTVKPGALGNINRGGVSILGSSSLVNINRGNIGSVTLNSLNNINRGIISLKVADGVLGNVNRIPNNNTVQLNSFSNSFNGTINRGIISG